MREKNRFHQINGVINVWRAFSQLSMSVQHILIIHSPLQKSCQGYLCRRPTSPPAQRPSNACPILTSFVLPTGLWFSTRPGKSNYTGVREVDFPIIDSMLRMRADDNTHITPLLPPLFLLSYLFCLHFTVSLLLFLPLFLSNSSFPKDLLSSPVLFFWISPSFIVHYSNFLEQRNEAWALSSFQYQNAGSVRLVHTPHIHVGHFFTYISVLLKRWERHKISLCASSDCEFFFCPIFYVAHL